MPSPREGEFILVKGSKHRENNISPLPKDALSERKDSTTQDSPAYTDFESDSSHGSDYTVKYAPMPVEEIQKSMSLKKENKPLLRKLTEDLEKNKSQEELILGLQATIASLEATIQRTWTKIMNVQLDLDLFTAA